MIIRGSVCGIRTKTMEDFGADTAVTILDVLGVDLCARAILDYVPIRERVRSERVCRRWQWDVHCYMQGCRLINTFYNVYYLYFDLFRYPNIYYAHRSFLSACKAVQKFEPLEETLRDVSIKNIATDCPYLQHLMLHNHNEKCPIQQIENYGKLKIKDLSCKDKKEFYRYKTAKTGDFFKLMMPNNLTLKGLRSAIYILRNVASLELDDHDMTKVNYDYMYLLIDAMPQLENLSLCNWSSYTKQYWWLSEECEQLIEHICRLTNLRRLHIRSNPIINDSRLEKLVQRIRGLKYLDISDDSAHTQRSEKYSAHGVAVLCRRSLLATTTLCLGFIQGFTTRGLQIYVRALPVVQQLEMLGCCVDVSLQWLKETSLASQARVHSLELKVKSSTWVNRCKSPQAEIYDLKIVLNSDVHIEQKFAGKSKYLSLF